MKNVNEIVEMQEGNVYAEPLIKKRDADCFNVYTEKIIIDPKQPLFPIVRKRIIILRYVDFIKYFEGSSIEQSEFLKTNGFVNCKILHDPRKNPEPVVKIEPVKSAELLYREERMNKPEYVQREIMKHKTKATKE